MAATNSSRPCCTSRHRWRRRCHRDCRHRHRRTPSHRSRPSLPLQSRRKWKQHPSTSSSRFTWARDASSRMSELRALHMDVAGSPPLPAAAVVSCAAGNFVACFPEICLIPLRCSPKKYPGRDNELTGGWAGGEVGLKAFVASSTSTAGPAGAAKKPSAAREPQPIAKGSDSVYLGKGRFIKDDAKKVGCRQLVGCAAGSAAAREQRGQHQSSPPDLPHAPPALAVPWP